MKLGKLKSVDFFRKLPKYVIYSTGLLCVHPVCAQYVPREPALHPRGTTSQSATLRHTDTSTLPSSMVYV